MRGLPYNRVCNRLRVVSCIVIAAFQLLRCSAAASCSDSLSLIGKSSFFFTIVHGKLWSTHLIV